MAKKFNLIIATAIIFFLIFMNKDVIKGQSILGDTLTLSESNPKISSISFKNNERVVSAKITILPVSDVGTYSLDIGEIGIDYMGSSNQTFDISDKINNYLEFCASEVCDVPIIVTVTKTGNLTVASDIQIEEIEVTPAYKIIEREKIPKTLSTNVLLMIAVILALVYLFFPKSLNTLNKKM